jgi:cupin 2 domain-containing protein
MNNIYRAIPPGLSEELIQTIGGKGEVRIERIVSHGHASEPGFWYDQDQDEFVLLLEGEAELEFENEVVRLVKGDYLTIPARRKHRVKSTVSDIPTFWLTVYFGS